MFSAPPDQGCTYTTICLYCRYTITLAFRSAVPIPIPIFTAGCFIIKISSNYCIPYMGKSVHVHDCLLRACISRLRCGTRLFAHRHLAFWWYPVWQTALVLYGDTSTSVPQMKASIGYEFTYTYTLPIPRV